MDKRVEGVYPKVEEALQAIDRLRNQGYAHDEIILVANEEVREDLSSNVYADVSQQDIDENDPKDDDQSFWDSIKDVFTTDDSYEDEKFDDPNYITEDDPIYEYKDLISKGHVAILIRGEVDATAHPASEVADRTTTANTQPNTIGPDGTRSYEDEQTLGSNDEYLKDPEMTTDELEDYERRQ